MSVAFLENFVKMRMVSFVISFAPFCFVLQTTATLVNSTTRYFVNGKFSVRRTFSWHGTTVAYYM
jgi:hypothetical protein